MEPVTEPEAPDIGCAPVPADLVELHEVLEWEAAVAVSEVDDDG